MTTEREWTIEGAEVLIEDLPAFENVDVTVWVEREMFSKAVSGEMYIPQHIPDALLFGKHYCPKKLDMTARIEGTAIDLEAVLVTGKPKRGCVNHIEFVAHDVEFTVENKPDVKERVIGVLSDLIEELEDE